MKPFTVAIMAGGQSTRMGRDKAFAPFLGRPLIEHVIERTAGLGQAETILIANRRADYEGLGLPLYGDVLPGKGSLGGIYSAVHHSKNPHTLVAACDMPFLNAKLLRYMVALLGEEGGPHDVVAPRLDGYPQGLHAIYGKECLGPVRARLDADRLKVIGFYDDVRVRYVDEGEYGRFDAAGLCFFNANTPQELAQAERIAANLR